MSDVLDRIRRELLQRLESTRAAAQEHERVRAALEALEHGVKPLEKVTRRAAGAASRRARGSAGRARTAGGDEAPATAGSDTAPARPVRSPASSAGRAARTRKPPARKRAGRSAASPSTAK